MLSKKIYNFDDIKTLRKRGIYDNVIELAVRHERSHGLLPRVIEPLKNNFGLHIRGAFAWQETSEGWQFWSGIANGKNIATLHSESEFSMCAHVLFIDFRDYD